MAVQNKKIYFELMRIMAILLVIFNHLAGYQLYMTSSGIKQWVYLFITMFTRVNVPVFFMISGALLLGKSETIGNVLKKRVSRFFTVLVIFSLANYFVRLLTRIINHVEFVFSPYDLMVDFWACAIRGTGPYWFLFAYLGMLLFLPSMQRIAQGMTKHEFYLLLAVHFFISSFVPVANVFASMKGLSLLNITSHFAVPFATAKAFFYPLIGYYLEKNVDVEKLRISRLLGLNLAALAGIVISSLCTRWEGITTGVYTQNYVQLFDYISAIAVFLTVKYLFIRWQSIFSEGAKSFICLLGSLTFGVYLLDPIFRHVVYDGYEVFADAFLPMLLVSFGWCIVSFVLGSLVTLILKKLPLFKKLL